MKHLHRLEVAVIVMRVIGDLDLATAASGTSLPTESRKAAADFTLTDANGIPFKISQFRGRVVLLDFLGDVVSRLQDRDSVVCGVPKQVQR